MIILKKNNFRLYTFFCFVLLFLSSCVEREHSNVFDPNAGLDSLDATPSIRRSDSVIVITWPRAQSVEVKAYNLYRRVGGEQAFIKIKSVPNNIFTYSDSATAFDIPHRYYLTYTGVDNESPPTYSVCTIPGPAVFWVLDDLYLKILRFTYDLGFESFNFFAIWFPQNFTRDSKRNNGLVTFTSFRYFEIFNLQSAELLLSNSQIEAPYDCLYLPGQDVYWISDSSRGIYEVNPVTAIENFITTTAGKPTRMQYHADGWVYTLDKQYKSIRQYDLTGQLVSEYSVAGTKPLVNPVGFHVVDFNQDLYIIDRNIETDLLIRLKSQSLQSDTLMIADNMRQVLTDQGGQAIWVSINNPDDGYLLQLSADGLRLNELKGFKYIADFKINPYNNTLVICDYWGDKVVHVRQDGSKIGETKKRLAPHKVYIQ